LGDVLLKEAIALRDLGIANERRPAPWYLALRHSRSSRTLWSYPESGWHPAGRACDLGLRLS